MINNNYEMIGEGKMIYTKENTGALCKSHFEIPDVERVLANLQTENLPNLFILSNGGLSNAAEFCMYNLLPRRVTTIGGDFVGSAAFIVFMCGARRLAFPDSIFSFHECFIDFENRPLREGEVELKLEILKRTYAFEGEKGYMSSLLKAIRFVNRIGPRFISDRSHLSYSRIRKMMEGDGFSMTAEEAKFYGIVHEIIPDSRVMF